MNDTDRAKWVDCAGPAVVGELTEDEAEEMFPASERFPER